MVLGVTNDGISALGEITEDELSHSMQDGQGADFGGLLASVAGRDEQGGAPSAANAATAGWRA